MTTTLMWARRHLVARLMLELSGMAGASAKLAQLYVQRGRMGFGL